MIPEVTKEELMKFLDDELDAVERARIERRIAASTELQRDLARYRILKAEVKSLGSGVHSRGIWSSIRRRVTRPLGWIMLLAGSLLWTGWAGWVYFTSDEAVVAKLAAGAIVIGVTLLLATTIHERWIEWQTDPYRDLVR
ncbi:MAG: hypothetical protein RQ745_06925 [Longimicrobiales bacterium]|nr:hypothetical protein [Longimicrobiales bacterium]